MPERPLPLPSMCFPPTGSGSVGPITYADDGAMIVGDGYAEGMNINVEGDNFTLNQSNFNDTVVQNFNTMTEEINTRLGDIYNDMSTTTGPIQSFLDVDMSTTQQITNMGDVNMGDILNHTDIDMRDMSTNITNLGGAGMHWPSPPQAGHIFLGLTKSKITGSAGGGELSCALEGGAGICSIQYSRPPHPIRMRECNEAIVTYQQACRECRTLELKLGRDQLKAKICWLAANEKNPFRPGGPCARNLEEPNPCNSDSAPVIAQQEIVTVYNISKCEIEQGVYVVLGREASAYSGNKLARDRFWVLVEACDICP